MVAKAYVFSTSEAEAGEPQTWGQSRVHRETPYQN
jgi:hypothetical protein